MKPFDLEAAKAGAQVQLDNGTPVRLICYDRKMSCGGHRVVGLVKGVTGGEYIVEWALSGVALDVPGGANLVMTPAEKTRTVWINVYPNCCKIHGSRESADEHETVGRLACIETLLKWEE